jgi:hypothetical protein
MLLIHDGVRCWAQLGSGQQVPVPASARPEVGAVQDWLTHVGEPAHGPGVPDTVEAVLAAGGPGSGTAARLPVGPPAPPLAPGPAHALLTAAVNEALGSAQRIDQAQTGLVIALLLVRAVQPAAVRVVFYPAFVHACHLDRQAQALAGERCLLGATPAALAPHLHGGWCPVAIAVGDDSPECSFLPVLAGLALTRADLQVVSRAGLAQLCAVLRKLDVPEPPDAETPA